MPSMHPAPRTQELISALKATWSCCQGGTKLYFWREFYQRLADRPAVRCFLAEIAGDQPR